ncbi:MAG: DUF547 domain-containing protein [Alphaproteobacteria bacterium]|nr:DUF547 domain-containing protein [Alphaproteobacteria bacterium]
MLKRAAGFCLCLLLGAGAAAAAPKAELWPRWSRSDPASTRVVDHGDWDRLLQAYVTKAPDGSTRFAYSKVSASDKQAIAGYVERLASSEVSQLNRNQQKAYWINLYNALTVKVILDHYPVKSIRDIRISPGLFASGPWGKKLIRIEGEELSLDDIEHRILRPIWQDARVHYAVNCASIGCPDLAPRAYRAETMETMLDDAARAFVNHPRGARIDGARLTVSSIYDWFADDFGGSPAGVLAHLKKYAATDLAQALAQRSRIDGDAYDWTLNEAK